MVLPRLVRQLHFSPVNLSFSGPPQFWAVAEMLVVVVSEATLVWWENHKESPTSGLEKTVFEGWNRLLFCFLCISALICVIWCFYSCPGVCPVSPQQKQQVWSRHHKGAAERFVLTGELLFGHFPHHVLLFWNSSSLTAHWLRPSDGSEDQSADQGTSVCFFTELTILFPAAGLNETSFSRNIISLSELIQLVCPIRVSRQRPSLFHSQRPTQTPTLL